MIDMNIIETEETPSIEFKSEEGTLQIKGRSIPENSLEFYAPLMDNLEEYNKMPNSVTKVDFQLEYFNTSSSKCILQIMKQLEGLTSKGNKVEIDWYYEEDDEEILEIGEDFSNMIKIPFNLKMISNN